MEPLIKQNGNVNGTVQYLGKAATNGSPFRLYRQPDPRSCSVSI